MPSAPKTDFSDSSPTESRARKKMQFDPTINLGHVLTAVTFLAAGFAAFNTLDKRVAVMEVQRQTDRETQAMRDGNQDRLVHESLAVIKESIGRIEKAIDKQDQRSAR
jgi:hypothetical protein